MTTLCRWPISSWRFEQTYDLISNANLMQQGNFIELGAENRTLQLNI
jgi:hypothetical protein